MKYYKGIFSLKPLNEDACDILSALLAEIGFETFERCGSELNAYVQQTMWNDKLIEHVIKEFPMEVCISYKKEEVADEDWNQAWEEEGFEPIVLDDQICIHDTQHMKVPACKYDILINPRMAFGTGTHPTTQMILKELTNMNLTGKRVIDAGCGTGVLGILASKCGAKEILAYDIDEWSTENTEVNFSLNHIDNAEILLGDSAVLKGKDNYDLLIANINRNILLGDMKRFYESLSKGGSMILSGFYTEDAGLLLEEAQKYGLVEVNRKETKNWCLLHLG